jgi:hypothetical protein
MDLLTPETTVTITKRYKIRFININIPNQGPFMERDLIAQVWLVPVINGEEPPVTDETTAIPAGEWKIKLVAVAAQQFARDGAAGFTTGLQFAGDLELILTTLWPAEQAARDLANAFSLAARAALGLGDWVAPAPPAPEEPAQG